MKTISGKVTSTIPISLSDAAKYLSKFAASDHGASHAVSVYLQRAADSFNQLVKVHEKLSPNTDDIKVEKISESRRHHKKKREVGLEAEDINKKSKNLGKEENPVADTRNTIKNSSKIDKVKDQKLINTEKRLDIGEGEAEKSKQNELEFVKADSTVKMESVLKEVKEDGVISRDKKERKKKNRGVGYSEHEVGKVEEDLGYKEEERKKRKSMDPDAGQNSGSTEQSSKKKSKRRRIEGEK